MGKSSGGRWLKGCGLGCLVLIVIGIGTVGIVGALQWRGSMKASDMAQETRSQPAPGRVATASQLADAQAGQALDLSQDPLGAGSGGTLNVNFRMGELVIVPTDGDTFEVEADYDRARFELVEEMEDLGDGKWRYNITFEPRSRFLGFGRTENRVEIRIPRGLLMDLEGEIVMGESQLELGGLALGAVDLEMGMGEHEIRFSEPTALALDSFQVEGRMGELSVADLGNASPAEVRVSHRMGEMTLDLGGTWTTDSKVVARCRMGECTVNAPEGANLVTEHVKVTMGGKSVSMPDGDLIPEGAPTITLDLRGSMGEVRIR